MRNPKINFTVVEEEGIFCLSPDEDPEAIVSEHEGPFSHRSLRSAGFKKGDKVCLSLNEDP